MLIHCNCSAIVSSISFWSNVDDIRTLDGAECINECSPGLAADAKPFLYVCFYMEWERACLKNGKCMLRNDKTKLGSID